ncbi:MAG: MFS transporter, partial [Trueperaceae bacterium]
MPEPPSASAARVVTTAAATSALAPLASTFVVVALPEMLLGLDASLAWGAWVVIAYLVAMAAVQPVAGAAGDRFGRERVLAAGLAGFVAASLVAAVAPNVIVLILARVGQALTGGAAIPNGVALVRARLPAAAQGRALGTIAILVGV